VNFMVVDECIVCRKPIEDTDLAFVTDDEKGTVCDENCLISYQEQQIQK
jgi:predicted nucleic acid-binding Zn ribbon protein